MQPGGPPSAPAAAAQLFREIHKNSWLRHVPTQDGRGLLSTSKKFAGECYWVVFCVHSDAAPFLEFYADPGSAGAHQPRWRHSLAAVTGVSGGLVPRHGEHRLVLAGPVSLTLAAPTWEDMKDWVETLRNKLREMKILQPNENVYSKPPEQLVRTRAPTRDPTSPLPPPPPGPAVYVPGTEIPRLVTGQSEDRNTDISSLSQDIPSRARDGSSRNQDSTSRSQESSSRNQDVASRNQEGSSRSHDSSLRSQAGTSRNQDTPSRSQDSSSRNIDNTTRAQSISSNREVAASRSHEIDADSVTSLDSSRSAIDSESLVQLTSSQETVSRIQVNNSEIDPRSTPSEQSVPERQTTNINVPGNSQTRDDSMKIVVNQPYELLKVASGDCLKSTVNTEDSALSKSSKNKYDNNIVTVDSNSIVTIKSSHEKDCNKYTTDNLSSGSVNQRRRCNSENAKGDNEPCSSRDVDISNEFKEDFTNDKKRVDLSNEKDLIEFERAFLPRSKHVKVDDAWDCVENLDQVLSKEENVSNNDFVVCNTSKMAKISGMNVCLVDSVIDRRLVVESDDDMFAEFDADDTKVNSKKDEMSASGIGDVLKNGELVKVKRDSKGYTQVDLQAKKFDNIKKGLLQASAAKGSSSDEKAVIDGNPERSMFSMRSAAEGSPVERRKPVPTPRGRLGDTRDPRDEEPSGVYVSLSQTSSESPVDTQQRDKVKPAVAEKKKYLLNRTSSVPDSVGSEQILDNYRGEMVQDSSGVAPSSNITIISVSNHGLSTAIPVIDKNTPHFDFDKANVESLIGNFEQASNEKKEDSTEPSKEINKLKNKNFINELDDVLKNSPKKPSGSRYVNVSLLNVDPNTFENINNTDVDDIVFRNKNISITEANLSVGSGYGHIRHSTSAIKPQERLDVKDIGQNSSSSPSLIQNSNENRCNVFKKSYNLPEIPRFKDKNVSEASVSTRVSDPSRKIETRGVYESVFAPFKVTKNAENISNSDKIIVEVPKLIVNIPKSPNTSKKLVKNQISPNTGESSPVQNSSDVFVKAKQIVDINREGGTSLLENERSIVAGTSSNRKDENLNVSNDNSRTKCNNKDSDYEFLSWIRNDTVGESSRRNKKTEVGPINVSQDDTRNNRTMEIPVRENINEVVQSNLERNDNLELSIRNQSFERNDENENQNGRTNNRKTPVQPSVRHGLFTRGLTELNIMSKFRNFSNQKETKVKNSQFYDDENNPQQGTSGSRKNAAFTTKLNNIFNKFGDGKAVATNNSPVNPRMKTIDNVMRTESSLRRNWSEHNDRTAPPIAILRSPNDPKVLRPRPPGPTGIVPRRPSANQNSARADRRRSNSLSSARISSEESSTQITPAPKPNVANQGGGVVSLREQQVRRLRSEMSHAGGIRLLLSSWECPEQAVALVDIYAGVWVAGWKQRSHPLLYNALHIGDRLTSVGGAQVGTARQARRAMQSNKAHKLELIIKRLPNGRVFALKRDSDRQDLGLMLVGATITEVVPGSPAARAGVPPTGTLTEVNGRPLNLLMKKGDSQVKERLGAIGREVSILVQPTEFVSLLRSALRAVRGHKDYIVQ